MTKTLYLPPAYDTYLKTLRPVAWWKLNDPIGSQTVRDFSGNGYTGNVFGGVTFGQTGPITGTPGDTAALFDGSTGYVSTTYQPTFSSITILVWVRADPSLFSLNTRVLAAGGAGVSGFDFYVQNGVYLYIESGGTGYNVPWTGVSWDTNWHLYALTWDGTTTTSNYDGAQIDTLAASPGPITCANPLTIGGYSPGGDLFPGDIAQVAIFDYALTPTATANLWTLSKKPLKYNKSLYVPSTYQPSV